LRGFNLDHGTDFATYFDGVPINLPTHARGEGYTDLNFLIPELIQKLDYAKGPYYAQYGDFASAGAADIQYVDRLPQNMALTTIGQYGYYRGLLAMSHTFGENDFYGYNGQDRVVSSVNPGTILGAIEAFHDDGPWDPPQNFRKLNFVLRYVRGDFYTAAVTDKLGGPNGGTASSFLSSPKLQMIFGPWFNTEFYLDGGFGFHSNDARGTTAVENPAAEGGGPAAKVPLLVQQRGGEVGVRSTAIPQLQTTFALWYLASNSELVFDGDTGDRVPTPASERYGIEFSNFYTPFPWLTLNADYA
jgi:TonB-dependent Receptor Plug Domain